MSWMTLEQACEVRGSRASWKRWIKRGEVATSKDEEGRVLLFVTPGDLDCVMAELAELRALVEGGKQLIPQMSKPVELKADDQLDVATVPEPARPIAPSRGSATYQAGDRIDFDALLASLDEKREALGLSDAQVQREVGLPMSFLNKARQGRLRGAKARKSWGRIAAFLAA